MTRKYHLILLLLSFGILSQHQANAKGAAAGELIYEYISDSTYRFYFVLYQECTNGAEPTSVPLCLTNKCNNTTLSFNMPKWSGKRKYNSTPANCTNIKTNCDSIRATLPGYKSFWYSTIVTLPSRCNAWKMFSYVAGRNNNIKNINSSTTSVFYVEASFDNTVATNNSSPYYREVAIPYVVQNQPYTYNSKAIDLDGDSLYTKIIHPQTGVNNCADTSKSVLFKTQTPIISFPTNPIQTGTGNFMLNNKTGDATFRSTDSGRNSFVIRTSEYRNGKLIGYVTREVQVQSLYRNSVVPMLDTQLHTIGCGTKTQGFSTPVYSCPGKNLTFCFDIKTHEKIARQVVTHDSTKGINITYFGQKTDSVRGIVNWDVPKDTKGVKSIILSVTDSTCRIPDITTTYGFTLIIYVLGDTKATGDTTICPNETARLKATEGNYFSWRALPGGDMNSINNSNYHSPTVTPSITTSYEVTSGAHEKCGKYKDTVTVTVRPQSMVSKPTINITISPDSNILEGYLVTFKAHSNNCNSPSYQWTVDGDSLSWATNSSFTTNKLLNGQIVKCALSCNDICPFPKDTFSNSITMKVDTITTPIYTKENIVSISPNPSNGLFTIQVDNISKTKEQLYLEVTNAVGQAVYKHLMYPHSKTFKRTIKLPVLPNGIYTLKHPTLCIHSNY